MKILSSEDHLPTRPPSLTTPTTPDKPPSITIEGCDEEDNNEINGKDKDKKKKKKAVSKKGEDKKEKKKDKKKEDEDEEFDGDAMLAVFRGRNRGRSPVRRLSTMY